MIKILIISILDIAIFMHNAQLGSLEIEGSNSYGYFGEAVSISDDGYTVAIGSAGDNSGFVQVYKYRNNVQYSDINGETKYVDMWFTQGDRIYAEESRFSFGRSISLSSDGSIVAIGESENDSSNTFWDRGQARIYSVQDGVWKQIGDDLNGHEFRSGDGFGSAVSLSSDGSIIAIGADQSEWPTSYENGYVQIYRHNNGIWDQIGSTIKGEGIDDRSGSSVSLSDDGSIVAIGAYKNDSNGSDSGHVRIFKNTNNQWIQLGDQIAGVSSNEKAGYSISLSADGYVVAIGAEGTGKTTIYQYKSNNWIQIGLPIAAKPSKEGTYNLDQGSVSLSSNGSVVVVGNPSALGNGESGNVQVYENKNDTWILKASIDGAGVPSRISPSYYGNIDDFGHAVSLSSDGSIVAIGAPGDKGYVRVMEILGNDVGQNYRLSNIRDYEGNLHGLLGDASTDVITGYKYQGTLDVNNDGTEEAIYTNKISGRWVTASIDSLTGEIKYGDHGQGKTTRVVGIYEDPLVTAGLVEKDSPNDGSRTFINDLKLDNLILKAVGDFDSDGFQELYWSKVDNTAYLRAVMHADGNIQYANYQNLSQMTDYLTSHGFADTVALIA